jgi:hypothetical protein
VAAEIRVIPIAERDLVWFDFGDAVRVARDGDATLIEWPGFLRMRASASSPTVIEPLTEIAPAVIRKLEEGLGRALPHYLRGAVVFHAAAISFQGKGLLVIGESGAGKSTTAAMLCARGATFIADDTAMGTIEGDALWLHPLETSHWLDADACRALALQPSSVEKTAVLAQRSSSERVRVEVAVVLEPKESSTIDVSPLRGLEAARSLLRATLRLPLDDERSKRDLDTLSHVARSLKVYRVLRGSDFSSTLTELPARLFELMENQ